MMNVGSLLEFALLLLPAVVFHAVMRIWGWNTISRVRGRPITRLSRSFITLLVYAAFIAIGLVVAFDLDPTRVFVFSSVTLAVAGFALQKIVLDAFSGILLTLDPPFKLLDTVRVGGETGKVLDIGWRATKILTSSNNIQYIPNGSIATVDIVNLSQPSPTTRDWFQIEVPMTSTVTTEVIRHVILEGAERAISDGCLLREPQPFVVIENVTNSIEFGTMVGVISVYYYFDITLVGPQLARNDAVGCVVEELMKRGIAVRLMGEQLPSTIKIGDAGAAGGAIQPVLDSMGKRSSALTPEQAVLIKTSWAAMQGDSDALVTRFYDRFIGQNPQFVPLFRTDVADRKKKLVSLINVLVHSVDNMDRLIPVIQDLGLRHEFYRVKPEYFGIAGAALVDAIADQLGAQASRETLEAWATTFTAVADVMTIERSGGASRS